MRVVNHGPIVTTPKENGPPKVQRLDTASATAGTTSSTAAALPATSALPARPAFWTPGSNIFDRLPATLVWLFARATHRLSCWYNDTFSEWLKTQQRWSSLDDHVIIGALPRLHDVPELVELGVCGVVNMCEEFLGHPDLYKTANIVQRHIPTVDYCSPKLADIEAALAFMREHTASGGKIYLHCKAGRGRSAVIALCWLIAQHNMTPEEAQARLCQQRSQVVSDLYLRPVVQEFAAQHRARLAAAN